MTAREIAAGRRRLQLVAAGSDASEWWACFGSVRGACGVRHLTCASALRCCALDDASVRLSEGAGARSDRLPSLCWVVS